MKERGSIREVEIPVIVDNKKFYKRIAASCNDWEESLNVAKRLMDYKNNPKLTFSEDLEHPIASAIPVGRVAAYEAIQINITPQIAFTKCSQNFRIQILSHEISHLKYVSFISLFRAGSKKEEIATNQKVFQKLSLSIGENNAIKMMRLHINEFFSISGWERSREKSEEEEKYIQNYLPFLLT